MQRILICKVVYTTLLNQGQCTATQYGSSKSCPWEVEIVKELHTCEISHWRQDFLCTFAAKDLKVGKRLIFSKAIHAVVLPAKNAN